MTLINFGYDTKFAVFRSQDKNVNWITADNQLTAARKNVTSVISISWLVDVGRTSSHTVISDTVTGHHWSQNRNKSRP